MEPRGKRVYQSVRDRTDEGRPFIAECCKMAGEQTPEIGGDVPKPRVQRRDANRILAALPAAEHRRAMTKLEPTSFRRGLPLYEPDKTDLLRLLSTDRRRLDGGSNGGRRHHRSGDDWKRRGRWSLRVLRKWPLTNGSIRPDSRRGPAHGCQRLPPGDPVEQRLARDHPPILGSPSDPGRAICRLQPRSFDRAAVRTMAAHVP